MLTPVFVAAGLMLAFFVSAGALLTPVTDVDVDLAYSGYVGDVISDPKGPTVVVELTDQDGNALVDRDGDPVRINVNEYLYRQGDQVNAYLGTGTPDSKYGSDATQKSNLYKFGVLALGVVAIGNLLFSGKRIADGLYAWVSGREKTA